MATEDASDLISDLDGLEQSKGPQPMTCMWWQSADPAMTTAVARNVKRVGHTLVTKHLRSKGVRVTPNGIRDHAAGTCDKCQS